MVIYKHGLEKFKADFDMRALIMHQRDVRFLKKWVQKLKLKTFPDFIEMKEFEIGPDNRLHCQSFIEQECTHGKKNFYEIIGIDKRKS